MNVHYEELNNDIKLIHDIDTLNDLRMYNENMHNLFYSLVITDSEKPIFEACRQYLLYIDMLDDIIQAQITNTLNDLEYEYNKSIED